MTRQDRQAPDGAIWICGACGRTARNRYDFADASCFLNSALCSEASVKRDEVGRIIYADAWPDGATLTTPEPRP